eukprot:COSAG02_NODE_3178_length_7221_cov_1.761163_7_plen_51_part_00
MAAAEARWTAMVGASERRTAWCKRASSVVNSWSYIPPGISSMSGYFPRTT